MCRTDHQTYLKENEPSLTNYKMESHSPQKRKHHESYANLQKENTIELI